MMIINSPGHPVHAGHPGYLVPVIHSVLQGRVYHRFGIFVGPIGYRPTSCFFLLLLLLLLLLLQSLSSSSSFPHFYLPQTPQPIHFPKAYDNSYSKTNREHKYKDESSRVTSTIFPHNLRNVKTLKRKQFYIF